MGFDNECILNIQSLAGEYFCPVCRLLVYPNEAIQSQCTHLYCKPCLTYVVSTTQACPYDGYLVTEADSKPLLESNKALADTIGKIVVHCLYHRSGCTWQGPLSECTSHCSDCAFGNSPVVCNRCGIQIVHRQVQEHAQNCPGVPSHAEGGQDAAASGVAALADQSQNALQTGTTISQASQTAAATPGLDVNQQANLNLQSQAVAQAAVPTTEQWYQQQQQYQQYYQQYPGYDPYQQQYQQYYPYQQQAVQMYQQQQPPQAQTSFVPGQNQSQIYLQPQAQAHPQPQVYLQPQSQAQPEPQSQPHSQSQSQVLPQTMAQPLVQQQPHVHAAVAAQTQPQIQAISQQHLHASMQPHSQISSQTHTPTQGQPLSQAQLYSQAPPHHQSHPIQPNHAPHPQMPYQQQHSLMQYPQPQVQPPANSQHPQHQPLSQPPPNVQASSQVQLQLHPHHLQPRPLVQPNQTLTANTQLQGAHPSAPAVTGYHSHPQAQSYQQMPAGPQQHSVNSQPQNAPHLQPQHLAPTPVQYAQQPQMRMPQSQVPVPNQPQSSLLPTSGLVPNEPPGQQEHGYPHVQQPGNLVPQRPVMQQQPVHQQAFPSQPLNVVPSQLHQQGPFIQQHQQSMHSHLRPHTLPQSLQQLPGYPQAKQNSALSQSMHSQPPMNHMGRPIMPMQSQPFPQAQSGLTSGSQVRPTQPSSGHLSANQNYPSRMNNQVQSSSDQQVAYGQQSSHSKSVATLQSVPLERPEDQSVEESVKEQQSDLLLLKEARKDENCLVATCVPGDESVENRSLNYESTIRSADDTSVKDVPETMCVQSTEPETENGSHYPEIKQIVEQETADNRVEVSATGKSVGIVVEEPKYVSDLGPKQADDSSFEDKEIQEIPLTKSPMRQPTELKEEVSGRTDNNVVTGGGAEPQARTEKGSHVVPFASASTSNGQISESDRESLLNQVDGKGFVQPSHLLSDPVRHHLFPATPGPSHQQRSDANMMLQSGPVPVPPHQGQVTGYPPPPQRPLGPGLLQHSSLLNQPHGSSTNEIRPAVMPEPGAAGLHPGSFDPSVGMMTRAPPFGPQSQRSNYLDGRETDSGYPASLDRGPFRQPFGVESNVVKIDALSGINSSSALGLRSERFKPMHEEHVNPFSMEPQPAPCFIDRRELEDLRKFPRTLNSDVESGVRVGSYLSSSRPVDGIPHGLGLDAAVRPLDKASHVINYDGSVPDPSSGPPRLLPPFHPGGRLHPNDAGDRMRVVGFHDDIGGRVDRGHAHHFGQVPGFGCNYGDGRSPPREYPGIPSRSLGFVSGVPGNQSSLDEGRESLQFSDGSKSFNSSSEPLSNRFHESRYPVFPSRLHRGDFDGPGNLRMGDDIPSGAPHNHFRNGDMIGQDMLPSHLQRGERFGPYNIPGQLRVVEPGFGGFPGHGQMGDVAGPGNFPFGESFRGSRPPRIGEPGFRSHYGFHGYSNDGEPYIGDMGSFDISRKRKQATMGWCRICKIDCETVEGLDLHSQTKEHQKMAMDMVLSIKKQNSKKHKASNDPPLVEETSKSRNANLDGLGNKH